MKTFCTDFCKSNKGFLQRDVSFETWSLFLHRLKEIILEIKWIYLFSMHFTLYVGRNWKFFVQGWFKYLNCCCLRSAVSVSFLHHPFLILSNAQHNLTFMSVTFCCWCAWFPWTNQSSPVTIRCKKCHLQYHVSK